MSIIKQLKKFGFRINWTLIGIGYYGDSWIPVLLTIKDVCQYALSVLEEMDSDYELVAQLVATEDDKYEFEAILNSLIKLENVDRNLQVRKWRVYIVNQELSVLPYDYTNGLLALTDLWISLGLPDDCPHIIQGRGNTYSPHDYYTQAVYDILVKKNNDWVKSEVLFINSKENST